MDWKSYFHNEVHNKKGCSMVSQSARCEELHLHAENLSRRVWELLMLLPTCPNMLQAFQNISDEQVNKECLFYMFIFIIPGCFSWNLPRGILNSKYVKYAETQVNLINKPNNSYKIKLNRDVSLVPWSLFSWFLFKKLFNKWKK